MAQLKTQRTSQSVEEFLKTIADAERRKDCYSLLEIMKRASRTEPQMWGPAVSAEPGRDILESD